VTLKDPLMGERPWRGEFDTYHQPPVLQTKLQDGTRLLASYHHAATVHNHQAMICLSEPRTYELLQDQAVWMHKIWGARGYMMSHDEIRVLNWCKACQDRHLSPGEILADNVKRCAAILREVNPGGHISVWSDMFDPNHNAVKGRYYLVNGSLENSWDGLARDVIIVPWNFERRSESLRFFAERGHAQIIAGYYDDDPARVIDWMKAARSVPDSVDGVIYTTWTNNYSHLEEFAAFVRK
jgi:hypothetical protein